jgi:hypothetical protein
MIELKTPKGKQPKVAMVDLFSIDGTVYQMPAKPKAHVALQYLVDLRDEGPLMAEMRLMERLLGVDGYRALASWEHLAPEDLAAIQAEAQRLALGALEDPQGNGSGGPAN